MKKWLSELAGNFDVEVNRNSFDVSKTRNASYNYGYVYPMYCREVHPNETVRVRCSGGFDLKPMLGVPQTHVRCHTAWYYVRTFQIWDHAKAFHRQDKTSKTSSYAHPLLNISDKKYLTKGSLLNHLGVPCHTVGVYRNNAVVPVVDSSAYEFNRGSSTLSSFFNISIPSLSSYAMMGVSGFAVAFLRRSYSAWLGSSSGDVFCHRTFTTSEIYTVNQPAVLGGFLQNGVFRDNVQHTQAFVYPVPMTKRVSDFNFSSPWSFVFHHINRTTDGVAQNLVLSSVVMFFYAVPPSGTFVDAIRVGDIGFSQSSTKGNMSISNTQDGIINVFGVNATVRTVDILCTPNSVGVAYIQDLQDKYGSLYVVLGALNHTSLAQDSVYAGHATLNSAVEGDTPKPATVNIVPGMYGGFEYQSDVLVNTDVDSPFLGLGDDAKEHLSALPVRAYEAICNFRFRNRELDPFRIDGQIAVDKYNTNSGDGLDSTTPLSLFQCQYEDDYFTTCMPSPAGNMFHQPLVGITVAANPDENSAVATYSEGGQTYNVEFKTDGQGKMVGLNFNSEDADRLTILTLKDAIQYGISLQDLQNRRALSKWYVATYRRGRFSHDDFVAAHFGKAPTSDAMHAPEYLGGDALDLQTMRVLNNSQADGGILGASGGLGSFATKKNQPGEVECYCDEEGYIIGVCWFSIVPTYGQAIDKMWYRKLPSDYPTPEFANLGTMPVLNKELAPLQCNWDDPTASDAANGTFGYQRIYGDLIHAWDDIAGDYVDDLSNLIPYRLFHKPPTLGVDFVYMRPEDINNVFVLDDDKDKIYGQWHFDTTVKIWLQQRPNVQIM